MYLLLGQFFLSLGSVSEFPGEVLRIKFPSLLSGIGLLLEAGLLLADRCLWLEETLPQSPFLGNFSQMHIEERRKITNICALPLLLFFG